MGGSETGLDVLLRCLEVLSTSEVSSIGPSVPPQHPSAASSAELPAPVDVDRALPTGSETTLSAVVSKAGGSNTGGAAMTAAAVNGNEDASLLEGDTNAASTPGEAAESAAEATITAAREKVFNEGVASGEPRERTDSSGGRAGGVPCNMVLVTTTDVKSLRRGSVGSGAVEGGVRQRVIRGLVKALAPWEHSRRSQRAALLVLGNVLENVVEREEHEIARDSPVLVRQCAIELDKGLLGGGNSSGGQDEEEEEEEEPQEDQRIESGPRGRWVKHQAAGSWACFVNSLIAIDEYVRMHVSLSTLVYKTFKLLFFSLENPVALW